MHCSIVPRVALFLALCVALGSRPAHAADLSPVGDDTKQSVIRLTDVYAAVQQTTAGGALEEFYPTADILFILSSRERGDYLREPYGYLWRTDGTANGTKLQYDFKDYELGYYAPVTGQRRLYLFAVQGNSTYLFRSRGAGMEQVLAVPGVHSVWQQAVARDDSFYYLSGQVDDPLNGYSLWRLRPNTTTPTNLWQSGPVLGVDPNIKLAAGDTRVYLARALPGESPALFGAAAADPTLTKIVDLAAMPSELTVAGDQAYFFQPDGDILRLWRSDGTLSGTVSLSATLSVSSSVGSLQSIGGAVVYIEQVENDPRLFDDAQVRLWRSDAWPALPQLLFEQQGWFNPINGRIVNGHFVFSYYSDQGDWPVWSSDGTPEGTREVSFSLWRTFGFLNGHAVGAYDSNEVGVELGVDQDNTVEIVKDIRPGPSDGLPGYSGGAVFQGALYFGADNGGVGNELWRSDGTPAGTALLKDLVTTPNTNPPNREGYGVGAITPGDNLLYFTLGDGIGNPTFWRTDGTRNGTAPLLTADVAPYWSAPIDVVTDGDTLYFTAKTGIQSQAEIWRSFGDANTTQLLPHPAGGPDYHPSRLLAAANGRLFAYGTLPHTVNDPTEVLVMTDGSADGMHLLTTVHYPQLSLAMINNQFILGGRNADPATYNTFWGIFRADDVTGWTQVADLTGLYRSITDGIPDTPVLTPLGPYAAFLLKSDQWGRELWRTDGTASGTFMPREMAPGTSQTDAIQLVPGRDRHFAWVYGESSGRIVTLWRFDGTPEGTFPLRTWEFSYGGHLGVYLTVGNRLFFVVNPSFSDAELYVSDGTANGTQPLVSLKSSESDLHLTTDGGNFYMAERAGDTVWLWRSDGTTLGTFTFAHYPYNSVSSNAMPVLYAINGTFIFSAGTQETGIELYRMSPGRCTLPVGDIYPGSQSSEPTNFTLVDDTLYFTAKSADDFQRNLWAITAPGPLDCAREDLFLPTLIR